MEERIHSAAAQGYTQSAGDYVRGRPDYPPEVATWLSDTLGVGVGTYVVELGAGTGKFTRRLQSSGAHVVAIEPVAEMRARLAELPQLEVLDGTAEAIPLADASADVVVCAQAFHWFANACALDEIRRVLKPGGRLGLIWNMRDASVPWVAALDAIVNAYEGNVPRYYNGAWRNAFPHPGFSPLTEQHFSNVHQGAAEDVIVGRVKSTSFIAALPADEQKQIEGRVRALIANEPALNGREVVAVPYETAAFSCIRVA